MKRILYIQIILLVGLVFFPFYGVNAAVCTYTITARQPSTGASSGSQSTRLGCTPLTVNTTAETSVKEEQCQKLCQEHEGVDRWAECTLDEPAQECPASGYEINYIKPSSKLIVIPLQNPLGTDTDAAITKILPGLLGRLIANALGIIGAITLLVFIYGGFLWLTSAGNEDRVAKGTHTMAYAAIGICIIFSSYAILSIVFKAISSG